MLIVQGKHGEFLPFRGGVRVIYFWYVFIVKEIVPQLLVGRQGRWTVVDLGGGKVALHNAKYNRRLVSDEPLVEARVSKPGRTGFGHKMNEVPICAHILPPFKKSKLMGKSVGAMWCYQSDIKNMIFNKIQKPPIRQ